jgi:hypothetical protein
MSDSPFRRPPDSGKRGSVATARRPGSPPHQIARPTEAPPLDPRKALPPHPASVGISIAIGTSTEFSREKVEVTAWCTVPCGITEPEKRAALQDCVDFVKSELHARRDEIVAEFFPDIASSGG